MTEQYCIVAHDTAAYYAQMDREAAEDAAHEAAMEERRGYLANTALGQQEVLEAIYGSIGNEVEAWDEACIFAMRTGDVSLMRTAIITMAERMTR